MNTTKTTRVGKDLAAMLAFSLLLAALFGALISSSGTPMLIVMALAFTVPATASAAVRLYRDLAGFHISA